MPDNGKKKKLGSGQRRPTVGLKPRATKVAAPKVKGGDKKLKRAGKK